MTFASPATRAARLLVSCIVACIVGLAALAAPAAAQDFAMTGGSQSFVVPAGVRSIVVTATGAPGSDGYGENGGQGGRGGSGSVVITRVDVTPGETLRVIVGQGGQNAYKGGGGDAGYGDGFQGGVGGDGLLSMGAGAGGSATVLMRGTSVLVVAGGGGGGGAMGGDGVTGSRGTGGAGGNGGQDPQGGGNAVSTSKGPGGKAGGFSRFTQGQAGGTGLNILFSAAGAGGGGGGGWYGGNGGGAGTTEFLAQGSGGGGGGAGGNYAGPGTSGTVITRAANQPGGNGAMAIDAALQSTTKLTVPSAQQGNNTNIPLRATVTNWAPGQRVSFDYMDGRMPANIMRQSICRDVAVVNGVADCNFRTNVTGRYAIVATTSSTNAAIAGPEVSDTVAVVLNTSVGFLGGDTVEGTRTNTLSVQVNGISSSIGSVTWRGVGNTGNCGGVPFRDAQGRFISTCTFKPSEIPGDQVITAEYSGSFDQAAASSATRRVHFVVSRNTLSLPMAPQVSQVLAGESVRVQPLLYRPATDDTYSPGTSGEVAVTIAPNGACDSGAKIGGRMTFTCRPGAPGQHTVTATWAAQFSIREWLPEGGQGTFTYRPTASTSTFRTIGARAKLVPDVTSGAVTAGTPFTLAVHGYDSGDNDLGTTADAAASFTIAPDGACTLTGCWAETTGPHVVTVTSGALRGTRTIDVKTSSDDVDMAWYTNTPAGYDPSAAVDPATAETLLTRNERRFFEARTPVPIGIPEALWYIDGAAPGDEQYGCPHHATAAIDHQRAMALQRCEVDAGLLAPGVHVLTARLISAPYGTTRSISRRIRVVSPPASLEVTAPDSSSPSPFAVDVRLLDEAGYELQLPADLTMTMDGGTCDVAARTCQSGTLGFHTVTVSGAGLAKTARVRISFGAGFYTRVTVTAARPTIPVAGDPGFVVRGYDGPNEEDFVKVVPAGEQVWERQSGPGMWARFDPYAANAFTEQGSKNLRVFGSIGGPTPITVVVTPGAVHHYGFDVVTDYTGQTNAGTEYGMRVHAYDRFNNDLGDVTGQFTIMVSGGTCSGSRCTWINSGTQSAMAIAADGTVLSFSRHINHDYALVLRLESTDATGSMVAGGTRGFRTISYDRFGNRVGEVTGDTTFTLDDGDCAGGSCVATTSGTRTVTASYRVPGTGIDVTDELTFQVEPASIDSFTATADRTTAVAGGDVALTIVGTDVHGNVVPAAATSAVDVGFDSGDCTRDGAVAHCAAQLAGARKVTASFGGVTRTYPVAVTAGNVAGLAIEPIADTPAGTAVTPTVVGWDAFYNVRADAQSLAAVSAAGVGCTGRTCTIAGTRTVTASIDGVSASRDVQVVAAAAANLLVTGPATVSAGVSVQFAAESFDAFGNSRGDVTGDTTFSTGTVDCPARSCAPTVATPANGAGTTIAARADDGGSHVVGSLTVQVQPGSLTSMAVGRSAPSIVAGGSVDVTAVGADAFGNSWGDITSSVTFSIDHGTCSGASCTSTKQGTRTITASAYGGVVTATQQVTVTPAAPWRIAVAADAPSRAAGSAFHLTATAYDTHGNLIGDVTGATTFTMDGGTCTVQAACTSTVMADAVAIRGSYLTLADTVRVDVTAAAAASLTFGADPVSIVAGATHQYTVLAFDVHGNAIGPVAATVAIGTDACPAGACRSTVAGTHTVTFRYGAATALGQLVTTPAALDHLDLTLAPATIAAGDSTTVGIVARDSFGNARTDDTTAATAKVGGVTCAATSCTTQVAGSHTVEASIPGASGDATLTVVPAPLHAIAVTPSHTSVVAGTDVTVTTTRADRFGNDRGTSDDAAQVKLDGVACDNGTCRLTRAGSRTITATIGSIVGTTSVTVMPAATHTVDVSLADGSIVADGAATTTAHIATTDRFGNPTPTPTASMSLVASLPNTGAPAIGALVPDGTGVWNATVTSSKVLGVWTLTATDATTTPATTGSAQLLQASGVASQIAFTSAAPTLVADGAATVDVDLHVTDAAGHAIAGAAPTVVASGAQVVGAIADRGDGDYRVRVTASTVAGPGTLTATLAGGHAVTLAFTQVPGAPARIELASDVTSIVADGASRAQVTATVRDTHGNAISDPSADVAWSVDNDASIVPIARAGATSSATVTSLTAGTATVRAVASGVTATTTVSATAKPLPPIASPPTVTTPASPVAPPASTPAAPPAITPAAVTEIVSMPSVAFNLARATPDRTTLPVTCPSTATRGCRGSVTVRATGTKGAVLGSGTVQVEAGASARLVVRLTGAGRRALATTGKVRVTMEVAVSNGIGAPTRVQRTVTIVAAPFAGVAIASTGRVDAAGKVAVRVTCPRAAVGTCSGWFDVGRIVDGARVRIVSAPFAVPGGRSTVVPVQLTAYSADLAAASGGLAAEVVAKARDTRPVTRTTTRAVVLVGR